MYQSAPRDEHVDSLTPNIVVVLSAYNGAEHIAEQLDSILAQDLAPSRVIVRDDGSPDGGATLAALAPYVEAGSIELIQGENCGVVGSFFELIKVAVEASETDYIALADQDDVWHTDKVSRAYEVLSQREGARLQERGANFQAQGDCPQLYCSEYIFCDAEMNPQQKSQLNKTGITFSKTLYENVTSGNTMVFNRALAQRIVDVGREGIYTHDWWIALVALATGELAYDDFASLEYRRTGSNASPTGTSGLKLLRYRIKTFLAKKELAKVTAQLQKLDSCFGSEMSAENKELLEKFLTGGRLAKAFARVPLRQTIGGELAVRILFLLGLL